MTSGQCPLVNLIHRHFVHEILPTKFLLQSAREMAAKFLKWNFFITAAFCLVYVKCLRDKKNILTFDIFAMSFNSQKVQFPEHVFSAK